MTDEARCAHFPMMFSGCPDSTPDGTATTEGINDVRRFGIIHGGGTVSENLTSPDANVNR